MKSEEAQYTQRQVDEMIIKAIRQDREWQAQVLRTLPIVDSATRQGHIETPGELASVLSSLGGVAIQPPSGGRVHPVRIRVNPILAWSKAIAAGGPQTSKSSDVHKVGRRYPARRRGKSEWRDLILVNFGRIIPNMDHVVAWADEQNLVRVDPRPVFAIGEHKPRLHRELKLDWMVIVATEECSLDGDRQVPAVSLDDAKRYCRLHWPVCEFDARYWFVFARK